MACPLQTAANHTVKHARMPLSAEVNLTQWGHNVTAAHAEHAAKGTTCNVTHISLCIDCSHAAHSSNTFVETYV